MPRSNGIYSLPPGYLAVSGQTIQPSQHNPPLEDLAQAMTDSLPRDGTAGMTGPLHMGSNQITGLGSASAAGHAPRFDQVLARDGRYAATGDLPMGGNKITGLAAATLPADAPRFDQVMPLTGGTLSGPLRVPTGDLSAPGVQFGNAANGIYWVLGTGPFFSAMGSTIGRLTSGTALPDAISIVTRQAGDARYVQPSRQINTGSGLSGGGDLSQNRTLSVDGTVVRTTGNQSIAGLKTFTSDVVFDSAQQTAIFNSDAPDRVNIAFQKNGDNSYYVRTTSNTKLEIVGVGSGSRTFRIAVPTEFGFGDGPLYIEDNANDGNGAGLCIRSSLNPSGNGMIFSARFNNSALGIGVQIDRLSIGRQEAYVGTNINGAGGNRVVHAGVMPGEVGSMGLMQVVVLSGWSTLAPGSTISGSSLRYANAEGATSPVVPQGTWRLFGYALNSGGQDNKTSMFMRIA